MNALNAMYICRNKDRFISNLQGKVCCFFFFLNHWIIYFQCSGFDQVSSRKILDMQIDWVSCRPNRRDFSKTPTKQMESPTYCSKSHLPHPTFGLGLMRECSECVRLLVLHFFFMALACASRLWRTYKFLAWALICLLLQQQPACAF